MDSLSRADDSPRVDIESVALTLELVADADADATRQCLQLLADKIQSREVADANRAALADRIAPLLASLLARAPDDPVRGDAVLLAATLKMPPGIAVARTTVRDRGAAVDVRRRALAALVCAADPPLLGSCRPAARLRGPGNGRTACRGARPTWSVGGSTRRDGRCSNTTRDSRPSCSRRRSNCSRSGPAWSKSLLEAIGRREIPASALNANQVAAAVGEQGRGT